MRRLLATLFYFNGLLLLIFAAARLGLRIKDGASDASAYLLLSVAIAALLTVLYQGIEPSLPLWSLSVTHAIWILSALGYIWLCNDALITFAGDQVREFSAAAAKELDDAVKLRQLGVSLYVLVATTGVHWVLRAINRSTQINRQQANAGTTSKLLRLSIAVMLIGLAIAWVGPPTVSAPVAAITCGLALLLASAGASRGGKVAWGVGVAEAFAVAFLAVAV